VLTFEQMMRIEKIGFWTHRAAFEATNNRGLSDSRAAKHLRLLCWHIIDDFEALIIIEDERCWGATTRAKEYRLDSLCDLADLSDMLLP